MLLSIKQIANLINYTEHGTRKFMRRLNIPMHKRGKMWFFDTSQDHPFAYSIRLQHQHPNLQVMYSITDLTNYFNKWWETTKDRKTIYKILFYNDLVFHGIDRKYVFLWDLENFKKRLGKIPIKQR